MAVSAQNGCSSATRTVMVADPDSRQNGGSGAPARIQQSHSVTGLARLRAVPRGRQRADSGLWHKDREVVTYSYGSPRHTMIAIL
jgi:hypothetical protein